MLCTLNIFHLDINIYTHTHIAANTHVKKINMAV